MQTYSTIPPRKGLKDGSVKVPKTKKAPMGMITRAR